MSIDEAGLPILLGAVGEPFHDVERLRLVLVKKTKANRTQGK
jgi:hypothetical protein